MDVTDLRNIASAAEYEGTISSDTLHRAVDIIDALVAALENFVNNDEYCREDYEEAQAALALARGESGGE